MGVIDRERLLQETDLLVVVERDLGPAVHRSGRWFFFCCPFHGNGEERTPSLGVTPDNGKWKCFSSACGLSGNVLDWVIRQGNLGETDILGAARILGKLGEEGDLSLARPVEVGRVAANDEPPGEVWQARGWEFLDYAKSRLWSDEGEGALRYLRYRGLMDDTVREWELGYNPRTLWDDPARWGMEGGKVCLSVGIVIPCQIEHELWYVQVRRPARTKAGQKDALCTYLDGVLPRYRPETKYWSVRGGNSSAPYGLDMAEGRDVVLLEEGEFNGIVAWQEACDLVDVVSVGSASLRPETLWPWRGVFLMAKGVLTRFDVDAEAKADEFCKALSRRFHKVQVPQGSDTNEFHQSGGSVRDWILFELAKLERER